MRVCASLGISVWSALMVFCSVVNYLSCSLIMLVAPVYIGGLGKTGGSVV